MKDIQEQTVFLWTDDVPPSLYPRSIACIVWWAQDEGQPQHAAHGLNNTSVLFFYPTFCKCTRGGKVAMTMALKHASLDRLVVVDMAPVKVKLTSEFANYVAIMKEIQKARVKKQSEADAMMKKGVDVSIGSPRLFILDLLG